MVKEICVEVSDILYSEIEETMVKKHFEDISEFLRQCIRTYLEKSLGERKDENKENNRLDKDVIRTPTFSKNDEKLAKNVRDVIREVQQTNDGKAPKHEVIQHCLELGLDKEQIESLIKGLKREGAIFEPRIGFLKTT